MTSRPAVLLAILLSLALPGVAEQAPSAKSGPVEKLVLARYCYWYQGDPRKTVPTVNVKYPDGASQFTATPAEGIGPWFSTLRTQWHRDQIADTRRAGIDVILPVYRGDSSNRKLWATQGLDCLVQALKEMSIEEKEIPKVGMFFDTTALTAQYGGSRPDLRADEVKQSFYGMIRDFFLRVPPEFRASVMLPAERGGGVANIVVLSTARAFSDWDGSFVDYCNSRFEKEFGAKLIWLGSPNFRPKAPNLDGYAVDGSGAGVGFDGDGWLRVGPGMAVRLTDDASAIPASGEVVRPEGDGWLKTGAVEPGYDDSAARGSRPQIRSRLSGESYRKDWGALLSKNPNWVIIDSWNDWQAGAQIAPDRQDGSLLADFTRLYVAQFNGMNIADAKVVGQNVPPVMLPKAIYQADLEIRNAGKVPWKPTDQITVSYRWFKDGKALDDGGVRVPLGKIVVAGGTTGVRLGIGTATAMGAPMGDGDYELRVDMYQPSIGWFADHGDAPLRIPVKIGKPRPFAATFISSTLPVILKPGRSYPVVVRVRNDGATPWPKGGEIELSYRWRKVGSYLHGSGAEVDEVVDAEGARGRLLSEVAPGRIAEIPILLKTSDRLGKALPEWNAGDPWSYQVQWEMVRGKERLGETAGSLREVVEMLPDDYGVCFLGTSMPKTLAGDSYVTVNVGVRNNGSETWTMLKNRLSYHWYYLDGVECIREGETALLPKDVAPGESVVFHDVRVKAPPTSGPHYLVFEMMDGDKWTSAGSAVKGGDTLRVPVYVMVANYPFFDLAKQCTISGFSSDYDRASGDFDGLGHSFASENLPPELNSRDFTQDAYPCGYLCANSGEGTMSSRHILFRWPLKTSGRKSVVACTGQTVGLAPDKFAAFHVMGAATSPDAAGDFIIRYSDHSVYTVPVTMTEWTEQPRHGEHIAATSLHRHSKEADEPGTPCYLFHYTLTVDRSLPVVAITFPNNPAMKIVALTGQTVLSIPEPKVSPLIQKLETELKTQPGPK